VAAILRQYVMYGASTGMPGPPQAIDARNISRLAGVAEQSGS